jgi:transposase-like protein
MLKTFLSTCGPFMRLPRMRKRQRRWTASRPAGVTYPAIVPSRRAEWDRLTALFDFPPVIRKVFYTNNAIESLNYSLRKVLKNCGAFPNDESIQKILYLALQNASKK